MDYCTGASFLSCFAILGSAAFGQPQAVRYDPGDATNIAELREYASRLWNGIDQGDIPAAMAGFQFSNISSMWPEAAFSEAIELFRKLYSDRLVISYGDDSYDVGQLVADDADVRAQFREYTTTGKITTAAESDHAAFTGHLAAIVDATGDASSFTMSGSFSIIDGVLVSEGLLAVPQPAAQQQQTPTPGPQPYRDYLKCLLDQSLIACMAEKGLYYPPHGTELPENRARFDCKAFSMILAAWLKQRGLAPSSIKEMSFGWRCSHTNSDGKTTRTTTSHSLIMVIVGGRVYVIDPQSGDVVIEFDRSADPRPIKQAIYDWLVAHGYAGCPNGDELVIPDPKAFPADTPWWPGTESPWYTDCSLPDSDPRKGKEDQDMCFRFKKYLAECCAEKGGARANCGGGTTGQPEAAVQDPCNDSSRFIWN